jgi:CRP-like cAMP-binding protein
VSKKELPSRYAGERTNANGRPVSNKILLSIPEHEYRAIRPYLEYLRLPPYTLHEPTERIKFAYFPNGGLVSLFVVSTDGKTVEAGLVGNEGVAGIPIIFGLKKSSLREAVLIPTDGFAVRAATLKILKSAPQLHMTLTRYAVVQGMRIAQTVGCNRLHRTEERLARWLLMAQDRIGSNMTPITHDFLATMLGTNRPTISYAAAILQKKKGIEYMRGAMRIVNRRKLEASACECYRIIRQFDREVLVENTAISIPSERVQPSVKQAEGIILGGK